eukprot:TRINITY_DN4384_c1_g1_i2.p1 TRINITY_DN4384_c1_g1~~TRINITY_DN4384_c1_g1_i2.p1  ORF type:complete len:539 (+),score=231.52 TRINITY_DN4384_c1_g1_i2:111-1727(+)
MSTNKTLIIRYGQTLPTSVLITVEFAKNSTKIQPKLITKKDQTIIEATIATTDDTIIGATLISKFLSYMSNLAPQQDPLILTEIDSWIEFANNFTNENLLKLNTHLTLRTYLVGYQLSFADIFVWSKLKDDNISIPENFQHVNRWYNYCSELEEFKVVKSNEIKEKQQQQSKKNEVKIAETGTKKINVGSSANFEKLKGAIEGKVVTRFPPEPSGYLHIGHIKACLLNRHYATLYNGKMIVRFDDTNPSKEKEEFVESILEDLLKLGITNYTISYTSDFFTKLLEIAEQMIKDGFAYIDHTPVEELRKERMDGIESKFRNNTIEENLNLWQEMRKATELGKKCVMRAKIDMKSLNKAMRDPVLYRYNDTPHHRTGKQYSIYPMYDFACPIVDSLEGVTHALRSSEYHDRNPLYAWMFTATKLRPVEIEDFSRLNFKYTLLSKRKLQWFADKGFVSGWDSPAFPTVRGILRRGLTVSALKAFVFSQGASKTLNLQDMNKLWALNKKEIDPIIPRHTALSKKEFLSIYQMVQLQLNLKLY